MRLVQGYDITFQAGAVTVTDQGDEVDITDGVLRTDCGHDTLTLVRHPGDGDALRIPVQYDWADPLLQSAWAIVQPQYQIARYCFAGDAIHLGKCIGSD